MTAGFMSTLFFYTLVLIVNQGPCPGDGEGKCFVWTGMSK